MGKTKWSLVLVSLIAPLLVMGNSGDFYTEFNASNCDLRGRGVQTPLGGDIPSPFSVSDIRVELADLENYTLVGNIRTKDGLTFLEIDFFEHPWLANADRVKNPKYLLKPNAMTKNISSMDGKRVRLTVKASHIYSTPLKKNFVTLSALDIPKTEPLRQSSKAKLYCAQVQTTKNP